MKFLVDTLYRSSFWSHLSRTPTIKCGVLLSNGSDQKYFNFSGSDKVRKLFYYETENVGNQDTECGPQSFFLPLFHRRSSAHNVPLLPHCPLPRSGQLPSSIRWSKAQSHSHHRGTTVPEAEGLTAGQK